MAPLGGSGESFTASLPGVHRVVRPGEDLRLGVPPEILHLFDAGGGARIG